MIEVLANGSGLSVQDAGRKGWRRFGVPSGGAMDCRSMELANRLLGNAPHAPVLEITLLGARLRVMQDGWLALAGANFCSQIESGTARHVRTGEVFTFDHKAFGLYSYLAVAGGFCLEQWFGSASTDSRNGMGSLLQQGDLLEARSAQANVSTERVARRIACDSQEHLNEGAAHFKLYPGVQYGDFSVVARRQFIETKWTVSPRSDRTGYRLEGKPLAVPPSIPSEPVLPGSFQVPGNGQPIVTMHDGPTVGGYAKIAVLQSHDLDRFAQCAPGTPLTFSWLD